MSKKSNSRLCRNAQLARPCATISPVLGATGISRGLGSSAATFNMLAVAVAGILYCAGSAYAADEQAPAVSTAGNTLEEVVVTASAQGVRKLDASFNIVTANLEEIQNANPA